MNEDSLSHNIILLVYFFSMFFICLFVFCFYLKYVWEELIESLCLLSPLCFSGTILFISFFLWMKQMSCFFAWPWKKLFLILQRCTVKIGFFPPPQDLLLSNMGCGCLSSVSSKVCCKDVIILCDLCSLYSFSVWSASGFTANFLNARVMPPKFSQSLQINHIGEVL